MCRAPLPPSPTPFPVFPPSSLLTSSLLPPHPSLLTPHSSLLPPHASLLPPHSSLLPPHASLLIPHPSKTAAVPQLRHSARSRGIHVPLHSNLDAATTRSMTACAGHRCPHHPHHSPSFLTPPSSLLPPPSSLLPPHPSLLTPHSARSSCPPALQLGCSLLTLPGLAHSPIECPLFHLP